MKVVLTEAAKADLIEIGEFIRAHNQKRAASFVAELLNRCEALGDMPRAFPLIPRYEQHGVRRVVHRDYLIFYRINLHRAIRSPARAGRAARLSDGMLLSREVYIKPKGAFF